MSSKHTPDTDFYNACPEDQDAFMRYLDIAGPEGMTFREWNSKRKSEQADLRKAEGE